MPASSGAINPHRALDSWYCILSNISQGSLWLSFVQSFNALANKCPMTISLVRNLYMMRHKTMTKSEPSSTSYVVRQSTVSYTESEHRYWVKVKASNSLSVLPVPENASRFREQLAIPLQFVEPQTILRNIQTNTFHIFSLYCCQYWIPGVVLRYLRTLSTYLLRSSRVVPFAL